YQKLSQLLPTYTRKDSGSYLQEVDIKVLTNHGLKIEFKSENIIDSWKHIHRKYWYHSLHQLSPYLGRFPPAIARYFVCKFSKEGQLVYDPFCGSGTVPLEACILNRDAIGSDVFIYAYTLSHAKLHPLERKEFDNFIKL